MKTKRTTAQRGIALMVVMIAVFVLSMLAGAFALAMKVETKLAMNANGETEMAWAGRSGVEFARWVVAQQLAITTEPYDSLNQKWAGGPGTLAASNSPLADISLKDVPVGNHTISITITDLERKYNINIADRPVLEKVLTLVGIEGGEIPAISSAIMDWIDRDNLPNVNGAETAYYESLDPPYYCKNKPIDDISELLLIRGIASEMYWGGASTNHAPMRFQRTDRHGRFINEPMYPVGLVSLLTPISSGKLNVNTASATTLQTIPMVDANAAAEIVQLRSGPDGSDGTEDDTPFRNVGELINAGVPRQAIQQLSRYCDVRSRTFEVVVDVSGSPRKFHAILGRNSPQDVQVLCFSWKDE